MIACHIDKEVVWYGTLEGAMMGFLKPSPGSVKGSKTLAQLFSEFGVHANQIRQWRKQLLHELPSLFSDGRKRQNHEKDDLI
jgi:hypothetical protein